LLLVDVGLGLQYKYFFIELTFYGQDSVGVFFKSDWILDQRLRLLMPLAMQSWQEQRRPQGKCLEDENRETQYKQWRHRERLKEMTKEKERKKHL